MFMQKKKAVPELQSFPLSRSPVHRQDIDGNSSGHEIPPEILIMDCISLFAHENVKRSYWIAM